jgi:uncharacterized protein YkwD
MTFAAALRTLALTAVAGLAAAVPAQAATARAAVAACPSAAATPAAENLVQIERTVLCLVNLERTQRGLPRLRDDARLGRAAAGHSRDMVRRDFFSHDAPGGSSMSHRVKRSGYLSGARSYAMGENIAWGTGPLGTPLKIMASWMKSPGHRANILNRRFDEIGVGVVIGAPGQGADGATYTTDFGARS